MLLFRIVSDSTDGNQMYYTMGVGTPTQLETWIQSESESQDSAVKPGSPWQWLQLFLAVHAPQSTLSANAKNQPYQSTHDDLAMAGGLCCRR